MRTAEQIKQEITNNQGHLKMPSLTFVICLAISAMLWVFVTLSREYTVTYDYSIHCIDLPSGKNKASVSSDIRITFRAKGFALLNPAFRESNRQIDLSMKKLLKLTYKDERIGRYHFTQSELTDYLKDSDTFGEEFVGVESPTISISLE